ncbi:hypothetical protein SAMN04488511_101300 [Pedobacter suwonensis]|uniref:Uncharacterized protein n=1 Tax=Pedobacter suwonensis TaxID=332999 RepID=A0A1I0SH68_9SPHI|nr:hypothetical protein [Pedobacter suwonensis]SFA38839.1 hypothetical protein SAMN04488511_101300 [Pedobacter suwonensis]
MKKISIKHLNNVHGDSIRGLDFYAETLEILKERLNEIAKANTGKETMIGIEHFQNLFIIHQDKIEVLKHHLLKNIEMLAGEIKDTKDFIEQSVFEKNEELQAEYLREVDLFEEMRHEFYRFAAEWM